MRLKGRKAGIDKEKTKSNPWRWLAVVALVILVVSFLIYGGNLAAMFGSVWFYIGFAVSVLALCICLIQEVRNAGT